MKTNLAQQNQIDNFDSNYEMGDFIVKKSGDDDTLYCFAIYSESVFGCCYIGEPYAEDGEMVDVNEIRPATTAEIHANRRLTEAEQALSEVS